MLEVPELEKPNPQDETPNAPMSDKLNDAL